MTDHRKEQIWNMISRIDSHAKVDMAIDFITREFSKKDSHMSGAEFDDFMRAVAELNRELYHMV